MKPSEIKQHILNVLSGDNLTIFLYLTYKEKQCSVGKRAEKQIYQMPIGEEEKRQLLADRPFMRPINSFATKDDDAFKDITSLFEGSSENVYVGNAFEQPFADLFSLLSATPEIHDFRPDLSTDGLLIQFQSDQGGFLTVKVVNGRRYLKNRFLIFGSGVGKRTAIILDGSFDAVRIDDCIIVTKPNDFSDYLDLDEFAKARNSQALQEVKEANIIEPEGLEWFERMLSKSKRIRRKFLTASSSNVLKMPPEKLLANVAKHSDYKNLINPESGQIGIKSEDDLSLFLKLADDSLLDSPITNARYNASVKKTAG